MPRNPGVYAEVRTVLDWIKDVTGDCNEKTCGNGSCVTWNDLAEDARLSFTKSQRIRGGAGGSANLADWSCLTMMITFLMLHSQT